MRTFSLFGILAGLIIRVTSCGTDSDCSLGGGVCFDGVGFLANSSCSCSQNQLNDTSVFFRCHNISSNPGETSTLFPFRNLTYEQGFTYPQNWTCHNRTSFCWATSQRALLTTSAFSTIANSSATFLSVAEVKWRCLDRQYRRGMSLVGLQSIDAYCVLCSSACGIHGVCDEETQECVCYPGYSGPLCRDISGAPSSTPLWDHDLFLLPASTYNLSRGCDECIQDKERCFRDPVTQPGRCYCDQSRLPTTNCELTSTATLEDNAVWNES